MSRTKRNARGHYTPPPLPIAKILGEPRSSASALTENTPEGYPERDDAQPPKQNIYVDPDNT